MTVFFLKRLFKNHKAFKTIRSNFIYTYHKVSGATTIKLEEFSEEEFVFFFSTFSNSQRNLVYNDPVNFYMKTGPSGFDNDDNIKNYGITNEGSFRLFYINSNGKFIDLWLTNFKDSLETEELKTEFEKLFEEFLKDAKKYFMLYKIERLKNE